jgi:hypothetical protein
MVPPYLNDYKKWTKKSPLKFLLEGFFTYSKYCFAEVLNYGSVFYLLILHAFLKLFDLWISLISDFFTQRVADSAWQFLNTLQN